MGKRLDPNCQAQGGGGATKEYRSESTYNGTGLRSTERLRQSPLYASRYLRLLNRVLGFDDFAHQRQRELRVFEHQHHQASHAVTLQRVIDRGGTSMLRLNRDKRGRPQILDLGANVGCDHVHLSFWEGRDSPGSRTRPRLLANSPFHSGTLSN